MRLFEQTLLRVTIDNGAVNLGFPISTAREAILVSSGYEEVIIPQLHLAVNPSELTHNHCYPK